MLPHVFRLSPGASKQMAYAIEAGQTGNSTDWLAFSGYAMLGGETALRKTP
jgi:hypothetical protein